MNGAARVLYYFIIRVHKIAWYENIGVLIPFRYNSGFAIKFNMTVRHEASNFSALRIINGHGQLIVDNRSQVYLYSI